MVNPSHIQIELPPMNGAQAFLLAELMEQIVAKIWRLHGDGKDFQDQVFLNWSSTPSDFEYPDAETTYSDEMDNAEIPF